jgi:hypothetical protein
VHRDLDDDTIRLVEPSRRKRGYAFRLDFDDAAW